MAEGKEVTTVEGLPARWAKLRKLPDKDAQGALHPVQEAWIEEQVPQCGICQFGMMIKVTELLEAKPKPTDDEIKAALTTSGPSRAFVPVRQLRRDPGRRAPCRAPHGTRWQMIHARYTDHSRRDTQSALVPGRRRRTDSRPGLEAW